MFKYDNRMYVKRIGKLIITRTPLLARRWKPQYVPNAWCMTTAAKYKGFAIRWLKSSISFMWRVK